MTRAEIERIYTVEDGFIVNLGKFEGEPIYVPYFYYGCLNGEADEEKVEAGDSVWIFDVTPEDREQFPELIGVKSVVLWERSDGFVFTNERR